MRHKDHSQLRTVFIPRFFGLFRIIQVTNSDVVTLRETKSCIVLKRFTRTRKLTSEVTFLLPLSPYPRKRVKAHLEHDFSFALAGEVVHVWDVDELDFGADEWAADCS